MPKAAAAWRAFATSRDAMASMLAYLHNCIAGMTCLTPILAVLRTPQRSFLLMTAIITPEAQPGEVIMLGWQRRIFGPEAWALDPQARPANSPVSVYTFTFTPS